MKILFCTSGLITGKGGIASYAHDFIKAFSYGNEFIVITNDGYEKKKDDKFEVLRFNMNDFSLHNAQQFLYFIETINPQIIVNSAFPLLTLITPYLPDQTKVISIAHFVDGKLLRTVGLNAKYLDSAIVLSKYAKSNLINWYKIKEEKKIKIVYNFMPDLEKIDITSKKQRQILKIVYPGGHSISKSADIVCVVLKKLLATNLNFEFYWLGDITLPGARWAFTKTKKVSDCVNYNDKRIKVFGPVMREEAKKIMAEANIFLLPSRGEGCPITLLEAMRGGCIPIISNAKHGSLDLITNNKNGFIVKQNSYKEIVKLIINIIKNHQSYNCIYDKSYEKFKSDLIYEVWFESMKNIMLIENIHLKRKDFNKIEFIFNLLYIRYKNFLFFLKDRLIIQTYSFLVFRFIKHIL